LDDKQAHLIGGLSGGGRAAVHGENYFLGGGKYAPARRRAGSREDFLSFQRRLLGHRLVFHDGEYPFYMLVSAYVRMRALGQRKLGRDRGSDCPMGVVGQGVHASNHALWLLIDFLFVPFSPPNQLQDQVRCYSHGPAPPSDDDEKQLPRYVVGGGRGGVGLAVWRWVCMGREVA
jgi:hypothetical protein